MLPTIARIAPILPLRTLQTSIVSKVPPLNSYGPFMWRCCMEYLHETLALLCDKSCETVCLVPEAIFLIIGLLDGKQRKHRLATITSAEHIALINSMAAQPLPGEGRWSVAALKNVLDWMVTWKLAEPLTARDEHATKLPPGTGYYLPPLRRYADLDFALPSQPGLLYVDIVFLLLLLGLHLQSCCCCVLS